MKLLFNIKNYKKRVYSLKGDTKTLNKIIKNIKKELKYAYKQGWNIRHFTFGNDTNTFDFSEMYHKSIIYHFSVYSDLDIKSLPFDKGVILQFTFKEIK